MITSQQFSVACRDEHITTHAPVSRWVAVGVHGAILHSDTEWILDNIRRPIALPLPPHNGLTAISSLVSSPADDFLYLSRGTAFRAPDDDVIKRAARGK